MMNTPPNQDKADLIAQAKEIMQEVADFLAGDYSHLPEEEYNQLQQQMMAKQSMAMGALLQSMGYKEKKPTLMQSEDADVEDIKRRAGLSEQRIDDRSHNFQTMKKIVQIATNYMQHDNVSATTSAQNIIYLARQIEGE